MLVTDKNIPMEEKLIDKLDLMIDRMVGKGTDDNVLLIDGDEGQGKSTLAVEVAYYVHWKTGRPFSLEDIYFDLDKLTQEIIHTQDKIFLWDEGSLGGLSAEWWSRNQIRFMKTLMVARKKRHFIIICIPKFHKLNEYFVVDRSIAMLHVYSKKNLNKGRFVYLSKKKKEFLFEEWRKKHKKSYGKYRSFGGNFSNMFDSIINEQEYNLRKDEAILEVGETKKVDKYKELYNKILIGLAKYCILEGIPITRMARTIGISQTKILEASHNIQKEHNLAKEAAISLAKEGNEASLEAQLF